MYVKIGVILATLLAVAAYAARPEPEAVRQFKKAVAENMQFSDELRLFRDVVKTIGPGEAQELALSFMASDSRTHMVIHEAGKFLYATEGRSGIAKCKPYFAGACYHGFLQGMAAVEGVQDAGPLFDACVQALSHDQQLDCAHGLGHAFLQTVGYAKLTDALDLCAHTFKGDINTSGYCYNGVFMENNFGEFNAPPAERWYRADDPLYPCNDPRVLAYRAAHEACWFMQSQATLNAYSYPSLGGDALKVAAFCDTLEDAGDKKQCFRGIGLQVQHIEGNDPLKMRAACGVLPPAQAAVCMWDALGTAYYFGDRAPSSAFFTMCAREPQERAVDCYDTLFSYLAWSHTETADSVRACKHLPDAERRDACIAWMQSPAADAARNYEASQ